MEKYNVLDLYVVKMDNYYFICEKLVEDDMYKEIFTNDEFKVEKNQKVEPLKNYYKLLVIKSYAVNESLMLNKKELLLKYAQLNSEHIERDKRNETLESLSSDVKEYIKDLNKFAKNNSEHAKIEAMDALIRTGVIKKCDKTLSKKK